MKSLEEKVAHSRQLIREVVEKFGQSKLLVFWTGGKDSTLLLYLFREEFGGEIPSPVFFSDSTIEFPEVYQLIEQLTQDWNLNLVVEQPEEKELAQLTQARGEEKRKILGSIREKGLQRAVKKYQAKAVMVAIRRDEDKAYAQEESFSKKKAYTQVNPLLEFSEDEVWQFIRANQVPYCSLYDQGYQSLAKVPLAKPELSEDEKEEIKERLRNMGYW
jgi:phosphoadenosine phosphosulfate reductase